MANLLHLFAFSNKRSEKKFPFCNDRFAYSVAGSSLYFFALYNLHESRMNGKKGEKQYLIGEHLIKNKIQQKKNAKFCRRFNLSHDMSLNYHFCTPLQRSHKTYVMAKHIHLKILFMTHLILQFTVNQT